MTICETLFQQEQELKWRRRSVYPLRDDSDRDFEFYVFVDAGNEEKRPPFLREIYHVLRGEQNFAVPEHKNYMKQWLGENAPGEMITPLNWIKIVIERYPYRLFVVIDPEKWQVNSRSPLDAEFWYDKESEPSEEATTSKASGGNGNEEYIESREDTRSWKRPKFLYKRICWISKDEFERVVAVQVANQQGSNQDSNSQFAFPDIKAQFKEKQGEYLKLWLYLKWVQHLALRVREVNKPELCLYFVKLSHTPSDEEQSPLYNPSTLPPCLGTPATASGSSKFYMNLQNNLQMSSNKQDQLQYQYIVFVRHANLFRLSDAGKWYVYVKDVKHFCTIYGEFLSGNLSYLSEIFQSLEEVGIDSYRLFLSLIEEALLQMVLIDERVQEHYGRLTEEQAGFITQQRVFVAYLDGTEKYAQSQKPVHGIYAQVEANDASRLKLCSPPGHEFEQKIFSCDKLGVDAIIIHQGILDKWQEENKDQSMQKLVLDWKNHVPFVIVTSGRGIPSNLPRGVKSLPFSGLEACMKGPLFEKLTLAKQMFALKSVEV